MRFHKNVPEEYREILTEQLKKYKKEMDITPEELKELNKWVAAGNSPYDNGDYIYAESGWPMDFVNAMRFEQDQIDWWHSLTKEEQDAELRRMNGQYDAQADEIIQDGFTFEFHFDSTEELPFQ